MQDSSTNVTLKIYQRNHFIKILKPYCCGKLAVILLSSNISYEEKVEYINASNPNEYSPSYYTFYLFLKTLNTLNQFRLNWN